MAADDDDDALDNVEQLYEGPPDASDGRAVRKRQQDLRRVQRADADVLRKVMLSPAGRSWLWRKLEACRAFTPSYIPGNTSPQDALYYEGQRKLGLDLLSEVMLASTDLYLTMVRENQVKPE
jgi:hypothetical protein